VKSKFRSINAWYKSAQPLPPGRVPLEGMITECEMQVMVVFARQKPVDDLVWDPISGDTNEAVVFQKFLFWQLVDVLICVFGLLSDQFGTLDV
jgi:hypothetical protein